MGVMFMESVVMRVLGYAMGWALAKTKRGFYTMPHHAQKRAWGIRRCL